MTTSALAAIGPSVTVDWAQLLRAWGLYRRSGQKCMNLRGLRNLFANIFDHPLLHGMACPTS